MLFTFLPSIVYLFILIYVLFRFGHLELYLFSAARIFVLKNSMQCDMFHPDKPVNIFVIKILFFKCFNFDNYIENAAQICNH